MHVASVFARRTLVILFAASLAAGCSDSSADALTDVCDLAQSGERRINETVTVRAWYGFNDHGSLLGSQDCQNFRIAPHFKSDLRSSFLDPKHPSVGNTRSAFKVGMGGSYDYHADFTGILRKRSISTVGDMHLPPIEEMPYVLEIYRVDNVRFEQATFRRPPPN